MMSKSLFLAGLSLLALASSPVAAESKTTKGEKPKESPGWVVIEEDWFYPLRFDSVTALNNARMHYRRNEERAAANEINRAVSWLKYAEGHALPMTKEKLTAAVTELQSLSKDLEAGKTVDAAKLDASLAKSSHALAEWHYFKAKEEYARNEEHGAARDLEAAALHLQHAANSAHYQFGPDTAKVFEEVYKNGKLTSKNQKVEHNSLGMHLQSIEKAVSELAETLKKA